ncbi:MAG: tRNA pseudouridine(38-40) synthase TruA [Deltaproteobacteria bacterium]|nr:tRNA pseudouridine(38-40) synthase TruA [Deltaproteobacteria bacterium]MBN2845941.1 tRNA pseudouridine(38-40) synthase TruA [Deltaproteobacteria bacterium]
MRNIKITVEYDGTGYHGWQRQPNGISIQEVLENNLALITNGTVRLIGSGRTDTGVHAVGQVANFKTETATECQGLLKGINSLLPPDVAVIDVIDVGDEFHARYSAKSKVYIYKIYNSSVRSPLYRNYSWHVFEELDVKSMQKASSCLVGTRDFSSFCAAGSDAKTYTRTVLDCSIVEETSMIIFTIEADGFLRYMVRNIIGTLVDVGKGRKTPEEFMEVMDSKDRTNAGITAPPQGLVLKEVKY